MSENLGPEDIWTAIQSMRIAMLTTQNDDELVSRPMGSLVRPEDSRIYFVTKMDAKVGDIGSATPVNLAYADTAKNLYVSVSGIAETSQDRNKLRELWSMWVEAWLPEGPNGEDIALVTVTPTHAKIWDATSSRLIYAGKVLKAVATQRPPDGGKVADVDMGGGGAAESRLVLAIDDNKIREYDEALSESTEAIGTPSAGGPTA